MDKITKTIVMDTASHTTVVETSFYEKLIGVAYNSFSKSNFFEIRDDLLAALQNTKKIEDLVDVATDFIVERRFVDEVTAEKERIKEHF